MSTIILYMSTLSIHFQHTILTKCQYLLYIFLYIFLYILLNIFLLIHLSTLFIHYFNTFRQLLFQHLSTLFQYFLYIISTAIPTYTTQLKCQPLFTHLTHILHSTLLTHLITFVNPFLHLTKFLYNTQHTYSHTVILILSTYNKLYLYS